MRKGLILFSLLLCPLLFGEFIDANVVAPQNGAQPSPSSSQTTAGRLPQVTVSPTNITIDVGYGYGDSTNVTISNLGNSQLIWSVSRPVPKDGLVACYPFNGNTEDESGHLNHAVPYGTSYSTDRFGNPGEAIYIDDKTDYIDIPDFPSAQISVSLWYYMTGTGGNWSSLLDQSVGGHGELMLNPSRQIGFYEYDAAYLSAFLEENRWYHIVMVKDQHDYKLYINGQWVQQATNACDNAEYPLSLIGNHVSHPKASLGSIDDVLIYNRVLSWAEIKALYQPLLFTEPQSGVVANGGYANLKIRVDTEHQNVGSYLDTLFVKTNDASNPSIPVVLTTHILPPVPIITPDPLVIKLNADNPTRITQIQLQNQGQGRLDYRLLGADNLMVYTQLPAVDAFSVMGIYEGNRYYRSNNTMSWTEANALCEQKGGHLVSVASGGENNFVYQNTIGVSWLGLSDEDIEGSWLWTTGELEIFQYWRYGEPNNAYGLENYTQIRFSNYGDRWNDIDNNSCPGYAVLEFDHNSILTFDPAYGALESSTGTDLDLAAHGSELPEGLYHTFIRITAQGVQEAFSIPVTVIVDYTPPLAVTGLAMDATLTTDNQITIDWNANAVADSVVAYQIFRRDGSDPDWRWMATVPAAQTSYTDTDFNSGSNTYVHYIVRAVDWADNLSGEGSELLAGLNRFVAPGNLAISTPNGLDIHLTWSPVTQTIYGTPGTPTCYIVYSHDLPSPYGDYHYVGMSLGTEFTQPWAAIFQQDKRQFYCVTTYSGSLSRLTDLLKSKADWDYNALNKAILDLPNSD